MNYKDFVGFSASISLTITLLPQLYKTFKHKKLDDISYGFFFLNILTCSLFLTYGILLNEIPLILANIIVLTQWLILFSAKIYLHLYPINNTSV